MTGWIYLIRNKDLYKIGVTKKFENRMRQLKPDCVISKLYTSNFLKLERELHHRYKKFRIPQTEYFRLEDAHIKEIKQRISIIAYPRKVILEIFVKTLFFILLIFFLIIIFISLYVNDINSIILISLLWMERISFGLSFVTLFFHSGNYLGFLSELKYRASRLIVFIIFGYFFRMAWFFLQ
tara:strand:- start:135 stop:677 length:543 start_codon:yes stop_codon:yes gene_type:complete